MSLAAVVTIQRAFRRKRERARDRIRKSIRQVQESCDADLVSKLMCGKPLRGSVHDEMLQKQADIVGQLHKKQASMDDVRMRRRHSSKVNAEIIAAYRAKTKSVVSNQRDKLEEHLRAKLLSAGKST